MRKLSQKFRVWPKLKASRSSLTFGWKYKEWQIRNTISAAVKGIVSEMELPRLVWITEFCFAEDFNHAEPSLREVFGHCVVDATSTEFSQSKLLSHFPGYLSIWLQEQPEFYPQTPEVVFTVRDDVKYMPRIREV
jgi:hypothetical protein